MVRIPLGERLSGPISTRWQNAKLFRGFDDAELACLQEYVEVRSYEPGQYLVVEGDKASQLYFIQRGKVDILKRERHSEREHRVATLGQGETMGEMALVDELPRTASARAVTHVRAVAIPVGRLKRQAKSNKGSLVERTYNRLVLNMSEYLVVRLREKADESLAAAQGRAAVGRLVVHLLIMLSLYVFLLGGLPYLEDHFGLASSKLSIPIQVVFGIAALMFIRGSGYPLAFFGIRKRGTGRVLFEALILTLPLLLLVTAAKWAVISFSDAYGEIPLFEHPAFLQRVVEPYVYRWLLVYSVSSVVQELTVRGALQSTLEMFLTEASGRLHAIVVAALLFSVCHLHMSFLFAVLAFLPGLYWGWLFSRQRNLAGVIVSHQLVGVYVFFILGAYIPH